MESVIMMSGHCETTDLSYIKLVKKAIKGDREAYGSLIKSNKEYLYKMAFLYVKNEEETLEVLNETVYRGFVNISKLKKADFFNTWITRILINVALDHVKKSSKTTSLDNETPLVVDKSSISIEEKMDLYNAIDLLRDNYKTVIIMKYFNGVSVEDISNLMDIPQGTVKTYLSRARKALGEILREGDLNE